MIMPEDLLRTSSPLGEADPVKFIQTLPGVSSGMEGTSAYYVRGGNGANNITTLDGVPMYGAGHLLGLTTAYPSEIISQNDFYQGGFPSDAGGFTSSLLQLTTRDGDFRKKRASFFVNNFLVGVQAEIPVKKDKLSLLVSGRLSPLGLEYNLLRPIINYNLSLPDQINVLTGDIFTKISWRPGNRDRAFLSIFASHDQFGYNHGTSASQSLGWSNLIANLTFLHETHSGWECEGRLSHNSFTAFQDQTHKTSPVTRMSLQSSIIEEELSFKASKHLGNSFDIKTGADAALSVFSPGVLKGYIGGKRSSSIGERIPTFRSSLFGQIDYEKGRIHTSAGLRATLFFSDSYKTLKPSASLLVSYAFHPLLVAKAGYDHSVQFFHSLEGIPTGWSMEMIVPSTMDNKPEVADQLWAGFDFSRGFLYLYVGGFYKFMRELVFYSDASSFFNTAWKEWKTNVESGDGHSYGLEIVSRVKSTRFNAQLSYTLSKTDRVFSSINFGQPIPFKFDRRHILNLTGEYKLSRKYESTHSLTGGISFMNGHWETVESGYYPIYSPGSEEQREVRIAYYTSHPNNFQLPAYFRIDLGYHLSIERKNKRHDLSFGIYNLTNRHNAYSLTWDMEESRWKKLSIFPIFPNFTYRLSLK